MSYIAFKEKQNSAENLMISVQLSSVY